jgi:hypothetical protein
VVRRTTQPHPLTAPAEGEPVHRDRGDTCADAHAPVARPVRYAVFALAEGRPSSRPATVSVTLLPPVSGLKAEVGPAAVGLHWSAHPDARVQVTRTAQGTTPVPVRVTGNGCRVSGLTEGQPQHFEVTAAYTGLRWGELAALRVFLSRLQPDIVVICPTSNDIDDSYGIWEGNLVDQGFMSGAVFRHSYEYRRRWIDAFRQLQAEVGFLQRQGIPTLIYFLAEWRKLAPYYADLAGFRATYTVVPTDLILGRYRLAAEIDPGQHASPEGHKLIASYLFNALIESRLVKGRTPLPSEYPVTLPGRQYVAKEVEAELRYWWPSAQRADLSQLADGFMANDGLFSVSAAPDAAKVVVTLHLVDEPALYPLTVTVEVASDEKVRRQLVFEHYVPDADPVTLAKPRSLDTYPIVEVRVHADRIASVSGQNAVSMRRPDIQTR